MIHPRPPRARAAAAVSALAALALAGCSAGGAPEDPSGASGATASSAVALVEPGHLTVCSESNYPPFEMEQDGQMVGLDMDLGREIAKDLGVQMKNTTSGLEGIQSGAALETGQCDVAISALTITDARKAVMDFSDPYFRNELGLVVVEGSTIRSVADARDSGATVGVMQATTGNAKAQELGLDTKQFEDALMFQDLANGGVDAILDDLAPISEHAKDFPQFTVVEEVDADDEFGVAVKKGNAALREQVDATIERISADGTLEEITDRWISLPEQ